MTYNVAIACSYRFEECNLLLEILKLNFKENIKTHVFCNLNDEGWEQWGHILDGSLVDELIRIPEPLCHPQNTSRDSKRRQPLQMFCQIVSHFGRLRENFAFLEGDCYPLDEKQFLGPFDDLITKEAVLNHFDFSIVKPKTFADPIHQRALELAKSQVHKMPAGYVCPMIMYFSAVGAQKLFKYIIDNVAELLDDKKNFEGCLGMAMTYSGITYSSLSKTFTFVPDRGPTQIDPRSSVVHQDRMFELKDEFLKRQITQGKWVNTALNEVSFTREVTGAIVESTGDRVVEGKLILDAKGV